MGGADSIPRDPSRRIQVIGAGYSRTGTVSLQLALKKLLDGPVMHGGTQILHREDAYLKKLAQAYQWKHQGDTARLHKLLENDIFAVFVGCTDMPPIDFIPDLLEIYPEANVVLTTRDPEKWAQSLRLVANNASLWWLSYVMWPVPGWRWFPTFVREFSHSASRMVMMRRRGRRSDDDRTLSSDVGLNDESETDPCLAMTTLLRNWNRAIQEMVPSDRLLIMNIEHGWEPLCEFLHVPDPDEPLPKANDSAAAEKAAQDVIGKLVGIWGGIFGTVGLLSVRSEPGDCGELDSRLEFSI